MSERCLWVLEEWAEYLKQPQWLPSRLAHMTREEAREKARDLRGLDQDFIVRVVRYYPQTIKMSEAK